ncbi:MAG TPA: FAD binding domain-containing protein [Dictyobacter sp.]|jgi:CO/xanthine dehydrogenase FAD-binding subunit|nr:FAD binding domain-containing protein [Dictyobacter sp.]
MLLELVEYHWAEDIDDVLLLLGRHDVKTVPLAGGTHLLGLQDTTIEAVVDLRDLGLAYVTEDAAGMHIGAMTTLQSMVDASLLKEFATGVLSHAAHASSSSRLIRNSATLGGTISTGIAAQADLLTALAALDAKVVVRSGSRTQVDLRGGTYERPGLALSGVVFKGKQERQVNYIDYPVERRANELIVEVIIPPLATHYGASITRIARTPTDVALLNAVALVEIEHGMYKRVRLTLGGVNMDPVRLYAVERQLEGQKVVHPINSQKLLSILHTGMSTFRPANDIRVSSGYRRVSGMSLAYRALEEAMNVAYWHSMVTSEKGL